MAVVDLGLIGSGQSKTSGTTLAITNSSGSTIAAGTLLVLGIVSDSALLTSAPVLTFASNGTGGTWATMAPTIGSGVVAASAGSGIWTFSYYVYTTSSIANGANISTITWDNACVARAAVIEGFTGTVGAPYATASATATNGAPAVTSSASIGIGDLVVGMGYSEQPNPTGLVADTDTVNGTWDSMLSMGTTGGSSLTNAMVGIQDKIVTAIGTQTYNPTTANTADSASHIGAFASATKDTTDTAAITITESRSISGTATTSDTSAITITESSSPNKLQGYPVLVLRDGPETYHRLGEASGTVATEIINGHHGTYTNTPTLGVASPIIGSSDTAVTFAAAASQAVTVPFWANLNTTSFTLEAWVRTVGSASMAIMGRQGTTSTPYSMLLDATGGLRCDIKTSGTSGVAYVDSSGFLINDNNWHHVVCTRDNNSAVLSFYIDGLFKSSVSSVTPNITLSTGFVISGRGGTPYFDGSIDEAAFYLTALNATQVADHFAAGATLNTTDQSAITITESSALDGSSTSTDDTAITITESSSLLISGFVDTTDTSALTISETSSIAVSSDSTDACAISVSEASSVTVSIDTTDSCAVSISESSSVFVSITSSDTCAISVTETRALAASSTSSDSCAISVSESRIVDGFSSSLDTCAITVNESGVLDVSVHGSDAVAVSINESIQTSVGLSATESIAITIDELDSIFSSLSSSESVALTIDETHVIAISSVASTIYVYTGGTWVVGQMYVYRSGVWKKVYPKAYVNGTWH